MRAPDVHVVQVADRRMAEQRDRPAESVECSLLIPDRAAATMLALAPADQTWPGSLSHGAPFTLVDTSFLLLTPECDTPGFLGDRPGPLCGLKMGLPGKAELNRLSPVSACVN
jgi:hypothetical protein